MWFRVSGLGLGFRVQVSVRAVRHPSRREGPLRELEYRFRSVKAGSAFGLDAVPPAVLKRFAPHLARTFFPVVMKMACFIAEPLLWKGGELIAFYKGRGSQSQCGSFRSILLSSSIGKAVHARARARAPKLHLTSMTRLFRCKERDKCRFFCLLMEGPITPAYTRNPQALNPRP